MSNAPSECRKPEEGNIEKCHKMSQLMVAEGDGAQEIRELIDALRKIGYFESFRVSENHTFSGEKPQKRRSRSKRHAKYRLVKRYYKSRKQYVKERLRRKLCWMLSVKYTHAEIADLLEISRRTVIRDMNRIRPYYDRLATSYFSKLAQDRLNEILAKLEGKNPLQKLKILTDAMVEQHERFKTRRYRRHYQIILVDLTQLGQYGIPKISFVPKGRQTLAYPYKVRVHIKGRYEDKVFIADVGGFTITQTTGSWW